MTDSDPVKRFADYADQHAFVRSIGTLASSDSSDPVYRHILVHESFRLNGAENFALFTFVDEKLEGAKTGRDFEPALLKKLLKFIESEAQNEHA